MNGVRNPSRWRAPGALLAACMVAGCQLFGMRQAPVEPEPEVVVPPPPRVAVPPVETPPPAERRSLPEVMTLLERGQYAQAAAGLRDLLTENPRDRVARGLLAQLEPDPDDLFTDGHVEYEVQPGDTLSGLAREHLGDALQFVALARYNGIAVPGNLDVGQMLRIPRATLQPAQPVAPVAVPAAAPSDAESEEAGITAPPQARIEPEPVEPPAAPAASVDELHDQALRAWRDRSVDEAIRLWEQVLVNDPEYQPAHIYLERARELQRRLQAIDEGRPHG